ncbi:SDR family NAD(P)-dependent oxidoreductase [Flexibacterium corallicola]|uniref:SDR family NAD(P)-dependent oxidoreductase n=1 Tax=Flexibacterium corallicola TaxID=3037259 RepID=UPI00286EE50E|nr:SDR family NAD(P)-dependent oxidoreductase [Pseudovibrio sp. M1P-2-3]
MDIFGKTAVVTGAGSGIGRGLALNLSQKGMNVVLVGPHSSSLEDVAAEVNRGGGQCVCVVADVSQLEDVRRVADEAVAAFGSVYLLCNNAGVGPIGSCAETTLEEWEWTLGVNMWGVIYGIHVFLPLLEAQGEGHINTTASESGLYGVPYFAAYNTSKFAVVGLMQSLARDLRNSRSKVTVSVFCPGAVRTCILESDRSRPQSASRDVPVSAPTEAFHTMVSQAIATGLPPEDAAMICVEGIRQGKFWIFSHDHVPETAYKQAEAMLQEQRLTDLS